MLQDLLYKGVGAALTAKKKVKKELKSLEKKGKLKKTDAKDILDSFEKKGKAEKKRVKKEIRSLLKTLINELDLVTKKDLKKLKEELKK